MASAGDINGDGFDDFIIGAFLADAAGNAKADAGESYVVFGKAGGFGAELSLASVAAGTGGFVIRGGQAGDQSGDAVASAGDINGDGFDDLIVAANRANNPASGIVDVGVTTVIFGKAGGFGASIDLASFGDGFDGFSIVGRSANSGSGSAVASAGDVNGDGFADLIIGAPLANESYVVFGKAHGFGARIDLAAVAAGTGGFVLRGIDNYDLAGISVASAGDINGDGIDDLVVGARHADGEFNTAGYAGEAYVVFGRTTGFGASVDLSAIAAGTGGFGIFNEDAYDFAGGSVASAGDINGDGFDDLIIGNSNGAGAGNTTYGAGEAYVLLGRDFTGSVTHAGTIAANTLTGTIGADVMVGGQGADTLIGKGGADALIGGSGDDTIRVSDRSFRRVDGGGGTDTLALDGGDTYLTLYAISDLRIQGIERIDLTGTGDNGLTLTYREVLNLSGTSNALRVDGNAGDSVFLSREQWIVGETVGGYTAYTQGQATVSIATAISVTGLLGVPSVHLSDVAAGTGGFVIQGAKDYDQSGVSVRSAGDIDGDGFDDIIIGAHFVNVIDAIDQTELVTAGAGYVIYGKAGGFGAPLDLGAIATGNREHGFVIYGRTGGFGPSVDPGAVRSGTGGFVVYGRDGNIQSGTAVAAAGDINGDGFADLIIGGPAGAGPSGNRPYSGESYVVYGSAEGFGAGIDMAAIAAGAGGGGFVIHGQDAGVSLLSDGLAVTIDLTAPAAPGLPNLADESDSGASVTDNITRVTAPTFLGKTEANATVIVFDGTTTIGAGTAAGDGTWSIKTGVLANGTHTITTKVTDVAGNVSAASAVLTVKVDTLAPAAPSIPNLSATTDSGRSNSDNLTQVTTPSFSGTAEALATVTLLDGATVIGTGKANLSGGWSVTVDALAEGIFLTTGTGDLRIGSVVTQGNVWINVIDGSLIDANTEEVRDERTIEELKGGVWTALQLTAETGYAQKVADSIESYNAAKTQGYQTYWRFRMSQPNGGTTFDATFRVVLTAAETAYYRGELGYDSVALETEVTNRTNTYRALNLVFGASGTYKRINQPSFVPDTYSANFAYRATTAEINTLTASIKQWTEEELLYGISAGLMKDVTSTVVNIENPNIVGANITILTSDAVGMDGGTTLIDRTRPDVALTLEQRVALAAAERLDVQFLGGALVTTTVNFNAEARTVTRTDGGNWFTSGFRVGMYITIDGVGQEKTENATIRTTVFQRIEALSASVLTIATGSPMVTESARPITIAPVVIDPNFQALAPAQTATAYFTEGTQTSAATITRTDGGNWITDGFAANQLLRVPGSAGNSTTGGLAYRIASVNGTVVTLASSARVTTDVATLLTLTRGILPTITAIRISHLDDINVTATGRINITAGKSLTRIGSMKPIH